MSKYPSSPETIMDFMEMLPDEEAAEAYLSNWRWPDGFECPVCSSRRSCRLDSVRRWECLDCGRQTSVKAGTVMAHSKIKLRVWLYALWRFGRSKTSISALQLQKETGLGSYSTAWALLHKIRRVLNESDEYPLGRGKVEVDETQIGGGQPGSGRQGRRLGDGGAWLVIAIERLERHHQGKTIQVSGSARLEVIRATDGDTLSDFVQRSVATGSTVVTDGWVGYKELGKLGYRSEVHIQTTPQVTDATLPKVHLLISNLKAWLLGTFHGVSAKYIWAYCREFVYRFNRRHRDPNIFGFLARRLISRPWTSIPDLVPLPEPSA